MTGHPHKDTAPDKGAPLEDLVCAGTASRWGTREGRPYWTQNGRNPKTGLLDAAWFIMPVVLSGDSRSPRVDRSRMGQASGSLGLANLRNLKEDAIITGWKNPFCLYRFSSSWLVRWLLPWRPSLVSTAG